MRHYVVISSVFCVQIHERLSDFMNDEDIVEEEQEEEQLTVRRFVLTFKVQVLCYLLSAT